MRLDTRSQIDFGSFLIALILAFPGAAAEPPSTTEQASAERPHYGPVKFDDNDRRRIVDARELPYVAVGRLNGAMVCTAAIVLHPRIIVTAGHCITEKDGTTKLSNLSFQAGYQAGADLGRFEATIWAIGSKQSFKRQSIRDASQDWAICFLIDRLKTSIHFPLAITRLRS